MRTPALQRQYARTFGMGSLGSLGDAASDALTNRSEYIVNALKARPDFQTLVNNNGEIWNQYANLSNIVNAIRAGNTRFINNGVVAEDIVGEMTWRNTYLGQFVEPMPATPTPAPAPTPTPTPVPTPPTPPTPGAGALDQLKETWANLSTPVKLIGGLALGYVVFSAVGGSGSKRR